MRIKKVFMFLFFIAISTFLTLSAFAVGSPNLSAHFNSNGDLINGWYWLRDTSLQNYAQWIFERIPSGDYDLVLDITALATDCPSGGRGFPAKFLLIYEKPGGKIFVTQEVALPNVSSSDDLLGYTCRGQVTIPRDIVQDSSVLFVRIERISAEDNHIAFYAESVAIMRSMETETYPPYQESHFFSGNLLPETEDQQDAYLIQPGVYYGNLGEQAADGIRDKEDWYCIDLNAGQLISLQLIQPSESSFTVYLKKPESNTNVGHATTQDNVRSLQYVADISGIWSIRIVRSSGEGSYQLSLDVQNQNDAGSFRDVVNTLDDAFHLYPGEYTGFLKSADNIDWYKIFFQEGQIVQLRLEMPSDASFGLSLSRPGSTSGVGSVQTQGKVKTLQYKANVTGEWGIKINRSSGEGDYRLYIDISGESSSQSEQSQIIPSQGYRASKFYSNGHLIQGWYWLRDSALNHYAEWTFEDIPSGNSDLVLDITALATDKISGGRGFNAHFLLIYGFPGTARMGGIFQTKEITLPSVSPANDPVGYTCNGFITIPRDFIAGATTFLFRIERVSSDDNHVAFNQDSILLFTEEQALGFGRREFRSDTK